MLNINFNDLVNHRYDPTTMVTKQDHHNPKKYCFETLGNDHDQYTWMI